MAAPSTALEDADEDLEVLELEESTPSSNVSACMPPVRMTELYGERISRARSANALTRASLAFMGGEDDLDENRDNECVAHDHTQYDDQASIPPEVNAEIMGSDDRTRAPGEASSSIEDVLGSDDRTRTPSEASSSIDDVHPARRAGTVHELLAQQSIGEAMAAAVCLSRGLCTFASPLDPAPRGVWLQCSLRRKRSGFSSHQYTLHLVPPHGESKLLLAARRQNASWGKGHTFSITTSDGDDPQRGRAHQQQDVARLRSNFLGTEWLLCDYGEKPRWPHPGKQERSRGGEDRDGRTRPTWPARHDPNSRGGGRERTGGAAAGAGANDTAGKLRRGRRLLWSPECSRESSPEPSAARGAASLDDDGELRPTGYLREQPSIENSDASSETSGSAGASTAASSRSSSPPPGPSSPPSSQCRALRRELSLTSSSQNVLGAAMPRRVHCLLPWSHHCPSEAPPDLSGRCGPAGEPREARPLVREDTLRSCVRRGELRLSHGPVDEACRASAAACNRPEPCGSSSSAGHSPSASSNRDVLMLVSRESEADPQTGHRTLDFGGRVLLASVKNFQMELALPEGLHSTAAAPVGDDTNDCRAERRPLVLQFGKSARDEFILDFTFPLSPVQAFALALTALARKLASEGG